METRIVNGREVFRLGVGQPWFYTDSEVPPGTDGAIEYGGRWFMNGSGVAVTARGE
jgi:hypothetical protein